MRTDRYSTPPARERDDRLTIASIVLGLVVLVGGYLYLTFPIVLTAIVVTIGVSAALFVAGGAGMKLLELYNRRARWKVVDLEMQRDLKLAEHPTPNVTALHQHIETRTSTTTAAVDEQKALPAPIDVVKPLAEWMKWVDEPPHVLLGGRSKAGKTTVATAILSNRLEQGETVFIIDPHASDWLGLPVAGRISHEGELGRALGAVLALFMQRMQEREDHKARTGRELPHDHFGRMTVLVDEANAIADMLPVAWATFARQLASGSRKVGISLLILAQSPLVDDLKISSKMRSNFAAIALDEETARTMVGHCPDAARKAALHDELTAIGDNYPASAVIGAQIWILDRDGMSDSIEPANAHELVWSGWDFDRGEAKEPQGKQELVSMPALLPTAVGNVKLSWVIAKMLERKQPTTEIANVVASLALRAAPNTPREVLQVAVTQRAEAFTRSGNVAMIAAQLDRDELIKACVQSGAGVRMALQIYGGNRNQFYARAKQLTGVDT